MLLNDMYENEELWLAMKSSKYRMTLEDLKEKYSNLIGDKDLFSNVLKLLIESMHAEAGTLWVYDKKNTNKITAKAVYGDSDLSNIKLDLGEGIAGKTIQNDKALLISECQKDARWAGKVDKKTGFVTKSMICVPISRNKGFLNGCYYSHSIVETKE